MPRCIKETFDYEKTVIKKRLQVETKTRNHTIISFNNMYHNVLFMECFLSFIFTFTSFHLRPCLVPLQIFFANESYYFEVLNEVYL